MGRVAPGTTIRLYTQAFHDTCMHPFDEAEMLHTGLEKAVLEVRLLLSEFGSPTELLSQAMSPPKPARIRLAVSQLFESGAFMSLDEMSVVTDFGRLAAGLPVDLACSKLVHLGFVFGCLPDAIVMAAAQSLQDIFLMPSSVFLRDRGQFVDKLSENFAARVKADGGLYSEPLAYLAMYKDWITSTKKRRFADTLGVCLSRAGHMDSIVSDITSKMIPLLESGRDLDMLLKSERLKKCSLGRGQEQGDIDDIFCKDTNLLRVILAGACAPNFLIGEFRNSKAIEGSGFEKPCTLQFSGVSKELSSEKPFRMAFEHLKFKIEKYKKIEEGKVLVQMAVHRSDATKDDAAASEKSKKLVIHDLNFVSKLVFQLFHNESKHCLLVPNPNFRPGWDEAQHATVASVTAHRLLSWRTASCSNVKLYWRSPLGSVCDFRPDDDAVRYAVALSIRGVNENSSTEFAGGVSLLPSGLFGKVLQMVFTTPSAELVAETDVHRTVVFSCKIDGLSVVFEPSVLTLEDIAVVNRMRKVVSKSFTSLFPSGDIPLEEAVYKDTASDAIGVLIRLLERCGDSSRHQPASSGPRQEVPFCMEVSTDYLPQLSLDSDPRSDPEDDLDGDYGIFSSSNSDVPQIEAASRAVALSCLHFFLKRKDFPTKAAHLNRWLESRSSRIGGSIHEELCDTVWPDLKGLKIKQARVRINNLLLSLKCVAKIKRGRLTWDMQQVEGMVRDEDAPDGGGAVDVASSVTKTALRDDREEISRTSLRMSSTPAQSLTASSATGSSVPWKASTANFTSERREGPFVEVSPDKQPQLSLDSDPRSDTEDDLDGDYGIFSSSNSDVPQIEAASRAVALSCLHFFLKRKDFPTKAAHLNRWLESRSSRIGGSIHEELCDTVWPDLKGLKIKQARVRINNLLLSLKCVAKIKRGRLTWDMQQVEGMVRDEDAPDGGGAVDVASSVTKTALRDDREEISRTSLRMSSTPEQSLTAFSGCGEPWAPPSVVSLSDAIPTACCRSPSAAAKCSGTSGSCYTVSQTQRCVADLARHEGGGNALNLSPDGLRTGIASSGNMDAACSHGAAGSVIRKMQVTVTAQDAATDCSACAAMEAQNSPTGNASDPLHSGRSGGHNSVFGADSSLRGCDAGLSVVAETRLVALDSVALDPGDIANAELGQASQVHDCRVPGEESTYPPLTADVCELDPIVMARFYGADGLSHRRADRGSHAQVQGAATTADAPADGPQASPVMIARYQEDGKWYRCRLAGMSANGLSVVVVFCGYEDDGVQETPWDCVIAVEPGLAEALAARYLEGQGWELMARICGTLGLYQVAQLQYVTDADIAGLGLRPVQRNALLALVQDHRCCSRAVLASEG